MKSMNRGRAVTTVHVHVAHSVNKMADSLQNYCILVYFSSEVFLRNALKFLWQKNILRIIHVDKRKMWHDDTL